MKRSIGPLIAFLLLAALLTGCGSVYIEDAPKTEAAATRAPVAVERTDGNDIVFKDDPSLYEGDDDIAYFYITVQYGTPSDGTNHTFAEVNSYKNTQGMTNVQKIKAQAIVRVGDETGPLPGEIGYDAVRANASINVRGRTSTDYAQKSYRIDLYDNAGLWNGQRAIALNKHPADVTRLRNALYFELLESVPSLPSLRTRFARVFIKDETDPEASGAYVDYGLFTQVELPNNRYLRNHGFSRDGNLYKAQLCEMLRYPDQLKLATDPDYDLAAFSTVLEPKTTDDHTKLLQMLDAVNDYSVPIREVVNAYFDADNLTSYVAFNLLMGNPDSDAQNYLLYSPVNSQKWYYICWDGDGALAYYEDRLLENNYAEAAWTRGISNYWGVTLFNRMFRTEEYRRALTEKVYALHAVFPPERIGELIEKYRAVIDPYVSAMPDAVNLRATLEQRDLICRNLPYDTNEAYEDYMESLEKPMPFYLGDVEADGSGLALVFDPSYDFDGEFVRYDVQVATDWQFEAQSVVFESLGILETRVALPSLAPGDYFWRVIATNESGFTQIPFDQVETHAGIHGGMRAFTIEDDGTVVN